MAFQIALVLVPLATVIGAHLVPLDRVPATVAIFTWFTTLFIGALTTVVAAAFALAYLPQSSLYALVAELCVHPAIPLLSARIFLSGHVALHAAMVVPLLALTFSMLWLSLKIALDWWNLRSRLRRAGELDESCAVIEDDQIVIGVTPIGRRLIVISDTTLRAFDKEEFQASLSHEEGHLRRCHRPILLVSRVFAALSFPFPGSRRARTQLLQALERDADEYAVGQTSDPLALASAICKAATGTGPTGQIALTGGALGKRLDHLEGEIQPAGRRGRRAIACFCFGLAAATIVYTTVLVVWASKLPIAAHAWGFGGIAC